MLQVPSILGRKYFIGQWKENSIPYIFSQLMLRFWNFVDCYFTVPCLHSKRKILIWSTMRRNILNLRKKTILQKIFILSKEISYFSLSLSTSVCYITLKIPKVTFTLSKDPPWNLGALVHPIFSSLFKIPQKPVHRAKVWKKSKTFEFGAP